jgi:hypothetical protein
MAYAPYLIIALALVLIFVGKRLRDPAPVVLLPLATFIIFFCVWHLAAVAKSYALNDAQGNFVRMVEVFPTPWSGDRHSAGTAGGLVPAHRAGAQPPVSVPPPDLPDRVDPDRGAVVRRQG